MAYPWVDVFRGLTFSSGSGGERVGVKSNLITKYVVKLVMYNVYK